MRLEQLQMQNFGPYRDEAVDFTAFDTARLFLISGKTGSGKTTIFDALVYALYGTTTGGERSGMEMRANFAGPDEPTVVRLRFSHGGKDYVITRAPEQWLTKKRGSGLTKVAAKVSLKISVAGAEVDELTKIQSVGARIYSLIQLDADQFRQMVLLPQGKFRQFLDANSDAKGALLRQLFGTDLYARWQTSLNTAAKKANGAIQAQQARLDTLASQFDYGEHAPAQSAPIADKLAAMHQEVTASAGLLATQQQAATAAKTAYSRANAAYQAAVTLDQAYGRKAAAEAGLAALAAEADSLASAEKRLADLTWAHELAPLTERITAQEAQRTQGLVAVRAAKTALQAAGAELDTAKDQASALQLQASAIADARETLTRLDGVRAQLQQVAAAQTTATKAQQGAQAAKQQQQDAEQALAAIQDQRAANQAQQQALQARDQSAALQQLETLTAGLSATARTWQQAQKRVVDLTAQQAAAMQAQATTAATLTQAQEAYRQLHDASLTNQIASLVAQLSPGAPCPVCGSLEHPHPAQVTAGVAVSPAALRQADQKRQTAAAQAAQAQASVTQLQDNIATQQADATAAAEAIQSLAGAAAQQDAQATLDSLRHQLITLRQTVRDDREAVERLRADAQQLDAQYQAQQVAVTEAAAAAQRQALAQASAQAALQAAKAALPASAPTLDALEAEQQALTTRVADYDQATTANLERQQAAQTRRTQLQTTIVDHQKQVDALTTTLRQDQAARAQALALRHVTPETFASLLAGGEEIPVLTQQQQQAREAKAKQNALLADAIKQIAGAARPDLAALKTALDAADEAATVAAEVAASHSRDLAQARQLVATIEAELAENQQALADSLALQNLAAVVNGNNRQKLSLERYVLRAYLQQVLVVANKRLEGLSDGRYQLQLHQDPGSYHNDSGLEIDVYDDQVGEARSVHTLSGGESFIAALALALALGEVIQQSAGGISIDALFIDEGFGSLDATSLDTALEALEAIEGQSRMIGIISHVESLQTGIPDQLRVHPSGAGDSTIQVVHLGQ